MGTLFHACIVMLLALLLPQSVRSQATDKRSESPRTNVAAGTEDTLKSEQRKLALERAYSLSELFLKFNDAGVKALALGRLGDILWKYDQPFSRKMFLKALDSAKPDQFERQRRQIIMMLAKHDAAFAKKLIDRDFAEKPDRPDLLSLNAEVAFSLVAEDPKQAIEFANRSLNGGLSPLLISALKWLRRKHPAAADQLFLAMLAKATDGTASDIFMDLGTYLFTSPNIDPSDEFRMLQIGVGPVIVTDLTAERPKVSPALVHAYLQAAVGLLSRPISDQSDRDRYYALGRMLLPKTTRFAPELTEVMANALQSIVPGIAPALTQESSYANLYRTTPRDTEETLAEVDKNPSSNYRDSSYLHWVSDMCMKGEFSRARKINEKISDRDLQSRLSVLINFTEGARLTEQDQAALAAARSIAKKLPQGIERAVLFLGVAKKSFEIGDNQGGLDAINETVKAAENLYEGRKPFLLLNAASQLAPIDIARAEQLLKEAVRSFNAQERGLLSRVEWRERVDFPPVWSDFDLGVKGVNHYFPQTLAPLIRADPEYTFNTIGGLTDERLRSVALLAAISGTLKSGPPQT